MFVAYDRYHQDQVSRMAWRSSPEASVGTMRWGHIGDKPIFRFVVCTAVVFALTVVLHAVPLHRRPLIAALIFLFAVQLISAVWGFRYALFVSLLAALGFSWLLSPVGRFWLSDSRDVFALVAFLVIGITTSRLSDRARREALNADQRRAEAVAAQQRFADLVNSVEGIVWEADARTCVFSFVSEQAERILGYPVEQWLREPTFWKDHLHPEDRDLAMQSCVQATADKRSHDFEHRMIAADGRVVWLRNLVTVVIEDGCATQLRGVMIDVTKRKQDEETLREQANLLSLTHDAIFVRDMGANIKYWNRAAEEMYGWTAEEASGEVSHRLLKTVFPVPLEQIEAELKRAGRWEGEVVHTKKDRTPVVAASRWSLQQNKLGTPIAILEINNDISKQKLAEQGRRELEEQWRAAFESNPTMYFIIDAAGEIVSVNAFGAEQLGYAVDELVGQSVLNVFYEPDRDAIRKHATECFEQPGRTMRWEARKIRKDGTMLWVRETANAVFLKKRLVLLVVCEDISEQKRAEVALRRSEAYLSDAQRLTKTGSWAYNPFSGKTIYWSDEMFRIFGLNPQDGLSSEKFWQLVHPEDHDRMRQRVEREVHEKIGYVDDYRIVLSDGTVKHILDIGNPVFNGAGDVVEFVGTTVDVTERRRAEEELRAAETRFRTFVDHATDALFVHSADQGTIVDVNRQACESLGYTREELIGMKPRDFDLKADPAFEQWVRERLEAGEICTFEASHRRKDGTVFPVEVRMRLFWHVGLPFGLSLARDITNRRRAEQERERLRQLEADLAHINRVSMMGELAASLAHEIKQPIAAAATNVGTCLRWLQRQPPEIEEARETAARVLKDVNRAADIINRVRSLYTKEGQQRELVHVNEVIEDMIILLRSEASRHSILVHSDLAKGLPKVIADHVQLQQVFMNLMLNGIEAMKDTGGGLTIKSEQTEDGRLRISISDTGVGLPGEKVDHIFDAFFTTKPQGTGMGLTITRSIIEAHGGRLWASANPERGATFHFTLPNEATASSTPAD